MKDHLLKVMIRKSYLTCLLMGLLISGIAAQGSLLEQYSYAAERFVEEQNKGLLPIQDLSNSRIAFLEMTGSENETSKSVLQKYLSVDFITVSQKDDPNELLASLAKYDRVILNVSAFEILLTNVGQATEQLLKPLIGPKTILVIKGLFRLERADIPDSFWEAGAILQTAETSLGESLASQYIFDGWRPEGKGAATRLGYLPPEAMGMNANLLLDSVRAIVSEGLREQAYPGAQVLVAYQGKVVYHEAFGYHTYAQEQLLATDDIYDLASVTKVSSALAALMNWHGEGKFDLDAPLKTYYPDFTKSNKGDLVIRQILAHNARLSPWIPYWKGTLKNHAKYPWQKKRWDAARINDYRFKRKTFARDSSEAYPIFLNDDLWQHRDYRQQMYKGIRKSPLNEEGGYVYSGLFFYLLPDIVAEQAGMDYETYLKQSFYHKLGAQTITYNPLRYFPLDRIVPTEKDTFFRMTQIHGYVHDEGAAMMGGVSSNAGLFSSANDLAKLFQMYQNMGTYGGEQLIAADALQEFSRCQYCGEGNRRGLGFDKPLINYNAVSSSVAKDASASSFGHSGYTGTFAWVDPEKELLFIFLSNRVHPTRNNRKLYQLGIRPRIHQALYDALAKPDQ